MKVDLTSVKVIKKFDVFTKGDFKKQEFVVEASKYDKLKIQAVGDRIDFLSKINEGDAVDVSFFVQGSEWNDKFFVNLGLAYIKKSEGATAEPVADDGMDLPF